jgi:hypothetical protein
MPGLSRSPNPLEAAMTYSDAGIPLLPYQAPTQPEQPSDTPCVTCHRLDCPAPPLHPAGRLDPHAATQQANRLLVELTAQPHAGLATVTGTAFDIAEVHTTLPPNLILAWLADRPHPTGPALYAGHGRLQLLAKPHSYQPDRYDSANTAILYQPAGILILLPPSQLPGGHPVTWLCPLGHLDQLPDGANLFWTLADLAADRQLPDPSTYAFHPGRHDQHDTSIR